MIEQDRSVPLTELPSWVYMLSFVLFVVPIVPAVLVWGIGRVWNEGFGWWLLAGLLILVVVHEGVHALGWKFASRLPWSAFRFGIIWRALAPYCHATEAMNVQAYRIGGAAPLVVTGILPLIYGYLVASNGWVVMGAIAISAAVGDIFVLWTLRDLPADALVRDHSQNAGCIVYLPENDSIQHTNG
jgi:hypothetical protein